MGVLAIVRPYPLAAIGGTFPNAARLLTPDPKEGAIASSSGTAYIDIDLGAAQFIDTVFLGYTDASEGSAVTMQYGLTAPTDNNGPSIPAGGSVLFNPRRHMVRVLDAPVAARFIRLTGNFPAGFAIGVVAIGLAFRPQWGVEWGAGRSVESTGTAERLLSGGWGVEDGVTVGGYNFTLGDLQADEVRALYAIARDRGETKSLLVIENPDQGGDLSDRCHWGLFRKIEQYERLDPANTKWSLQIGDWG